MDTPIMRRAAAWFMLTRSERWWVAGVLALFLVGLLTRWWHLTHRVPESVPAPAGVEETRP